jgi:hypothetical protein
VPIVAEGGGRALKKKCRCRPGPPGGGGHGAASGPGQRPTQRVLLAQARPSLAGGPGDSEAPAFPGRPQCAKISGACPGHPAHGRHRDRSGSVAARRSLAVRASLPLSGELRMCGIGATEWRTARGRASSSADMRAAIARCRGIASPAAVPLGLGRWSSRQAARALGRAKPLDKLLRVQKHAHERIASEMPHENFS